MTVSHFQDVQELQRDRRAFVKSTSTKVQAEVWLSANNLTPFHELISTERIRLDAQPCEFRSRIANQSDSISCKELVGASRNVGFRLGLTAQCHKDASYYLFGLFSTGPTPSSQW